VDDGERAIEIERLFKELAEATARRGALLEEAQEFAARLHDIRAAFGNPFFYSNLRAPMSQPQTIRPQAATK
jgi:hypothetical protein